MKKHLALLLVFTLMVSMLSFAATNPKDAGDALKELGVIKGDANGNLNADKQLTREEAVTTLARLMGKEKQAMATTVAPSFSDVPGNHWAKPYIAYAELKSWTNGIGGGKFGLGQYVTTQQYVTYMLRVLGYGDTPYSQSMVQAAKLGLLDDVKATKGDAIITRGDVFVVMYHTLYSKAKGADQALVYALGLKDNPAPTPTPTPTPKTATVDKVVTDSLGQIKIMLTAAIKSAGDEDNYDLDTKGTAKIDQYSTFKLSEDKKAIIITLTKPAEQQEKVDLEIKNVLAKDVKLNDIQFLDKTLPELVKAEVVGEDKIKLTFSEPMLLSNADKSMSNKDNYEIRDNDDSRIYIDSVKSNNDSNTEAIIDLYDKLDGDVKLSIKNVDDLSGLNVTISNYVVKYQKDSEAPKVTSFKNASLNKITLVFNEDVVFVGKVDGFYHTNSGNPAKTVKVDGDEVTLTFDKGDELPAGTAYIYIKDDTITDLWGNEMDKVYSEVTVTADRKAPEVVGGVKVLNQKKIEVKFDENIKKNSDFDITLFKSGDVVKNRATGSTDDNKLTITFTSDLYGNHKVMLEGIEDEFGNEINKTTLSFNATDATAPNADKFTATAYNVDEDVQIIVVDFSDEMKESDIEDKTNYQLDGKQLDTLDVEVQAIEDNSKVKISIPKKAYDLVASDLDGNNNLLTIGKLSDAAGNKMVEFSVTLDVINGDKQGIKLKQVRLVEPKKVEFEVADKLDSVTVEQFVLYADGKKAKLAGHSIDTNSDNHTVISFKLAETVGSDPDDDNVKYVVLSKSDLDDDNLKPSKNRYGQILSAADGDVADKCAPEVLKVVFLDSTFIHVYFTEALDSGYVSVKGHNGFSVSDGELTDATLNTRNPYIMVLTGKKFTKTTDIIYSDSNIYDKNGNELASFEFTETLKSVD